MDVRLPARIQELPRHQRRLVAACQAGMAEPEVLGMAIAGSFVEGTPDQVSDLDLRIVLADGSFDHVFSRREQLAGACGTLVAAFTGEHVGEPHLLITLYQDLVHVDFLFAELSEAPARNDGRPVDILWERDQRVAAALADRTLPDPSDELAFVEARMWTWTWYIQSKILRGELWEAMSGLAHVRDWVLFRLLALTRGIRHRGARFAEATLGVEAESFARTLSPLDPDSLLAALRQTVDLYRRMADPLLALYDVASARQAREAVLAALDAGLAWRAD